MQILSDIPFTLDAESLMDSLRIEPGSDDARDFEAYIQLAESIGNPKAVYREAFVDERTDDSVRLGEITLTSRMLSANLSSAERVFAFVATCGKEVHDGDPSNGDFLKEFWWDAIKSRLLGAARKHLGDLLQDAHRLGKTASMSPGSGDATVWPIEQQRPLFALIGDVREAIGVELTDSFLMIPNKSVSGITFRTEDDFRSCQVCHRDGCPSRSAPFDEKLWQSIQHD